MSFTRVVVLAFDGVSLFHLSLPSIVLNGVNSISDEQTYEVRYCTHIPGWIKSDQGIMIEVKDGLHTMHNADIIIVPSWKDEPATTVPKALIDMLKDAHAKGKLIVGLCMGAFVLGESGLLDGRKATTHWMARARFAKRFPLTHFRPNDLYVADGNIVTSAGTVAAIDCCLNLVRERNGADAANRTARLLVTPPHRQGGQVQYIEHPVPELPSENRLPGVLEWAREHLSEPLSVAKFADVACMSRRTFTRRFRETTGTTVIKWLNAERVVRAQQLLEITDLSIEAISFATGFGTSLSLRQQFSTQLGISPTSYRRTFYKKVKKLS